LRGEILKTGFGFDPLPQLHWGKTIAHLNTICVLQWGGRLRLSCIPRRSPARARKGVFGVLGDGVSGLLAGRGYQVDTAAVELL
jgi:hypothetical protein